MPACYIISNALICDIVCRGFHACAVNAAHYTNVLTTAEQINISIHIIIVQGISLLYKCMHASGALVNSKTMHSYRVANLTRTHI